MIAVSLMLLGRYAVSAEVAAVVTTVSVGVFSVMTFGVFEPDGRERMVDFCVLAVELVVIKLMV